MLFDKIKNETAWQKINARRITPLNDYISEKLNLTIFIDDVEVVKEFINSSTNLVQVILI